MNKKTFHPLLLKGSFPFSWRDLLITLALMALGFVICSLLQIISDSDSHVPLIFVLVVLLVSLFTDGYLFGLASSVFSIFAVNYAFTFPYFHFNFSLTGYPLTFVCMFVVSAITCTLMSRVRKTEKVRLEAEREKMRADLLRAISHDFRTPLTSIVGTLGVLAEDEGLLTERDRRTLLSDAKSDGEWLINMMENILSITRIGADNAPKLHTEPQMAEEVAAEAVVRFRKQHKDLKVDIRVPDEIIMVDMDAMLIEQVIINLLVNVVIHGKTATHALLSINREENMARFTVDDNGSGLNKRSLERILQGKTVETPEGETKDSRRTMGIGLSVCRTIVYAHGGELFAENRTEGGARISFTLPITEDNENGNTFQDTDS